MEESQRNYEISIILKREEGLEPVLLVLKKYDVKVVESSAVERIRLAYKIKKETVGFLVTFIVEAEKAKIADLRHALELDEEILRYLLITPPIKKHVPSLRMQGDIRMASKNTDEVKIANENIVTKDELVEEATLNEKVSKVEKKEDDVLSNEYLEKKLEEKL